MKWKYIIILTIGVFLTGFILVGVGSTNLGTILILLSPLIPIIKVVVFICRKLGIKLEKPRPKKIVAKEKILLKEEDFPYFQQKDLIKPQPVSKNDTFITFDKIDWSKYKVKCPFCKAGIPADALKCSHCTADLTEQKSQMEIERQIREIKKRGIVVGVISVILVISFFGLIGWISLSTPATPSQQQITKLQIGDEGFLKVGDDPNQVVFLATDLDAFNELLKIIRAKDEYGLLTLGLQGRAFGVTNGTKVKIIDTGLGKRRVRIIQGIKPIDEDKVGLSGWIPKEWVVSQF